MIFKKRHKHAKRPSTVEKFKQPKEFHEANKIYTVAFVIDGVVEEIMRTEARFSALLTSNPIIIDVTENESNPQLGWTYDEKTGEFKNEEVQQEENSEGTDS